ncbi:MAG: dihydrodipicolinate synthase family protein [Myxococcota bacterium]
MSTAHPSTRVKPGRTIRGMSAILLPFEPDGAVDWKGFEAHVARTAGAGLRPAINMDTGYAQLIDPGTRERALDIAQQVTAGDFVAGAFAADEAGDPFRPERYAPGIEAIQKRGGLPILFPSHGLNALDDADWVQALATLGDQCDRFLAFELGPMFVPYGRIYGLDAYRGLLEIERCIGAKHSSLSRELEWQRLAVRDEVRPDFMVLTGNDLAIDMVMYGSDYLLGLSTFDPEAFALRDRYWAEGDPRFYELNDWLQYLGFFAFRPPVPAYKHDAAMFLHHRDAIASDRTHPQSAARPAHDVDVLADISHRLEELCA